MYLAFDTRIVLLVCSLLEGLAGLRMVKVSIPAYKMRGESVFLECQYELNRPQHMAHTRAHYNQRETGQQSQHGQHNDMNYMDAESAAEQAPATYRRMRTYSHQLQSQTQRQQYQPPQHRYQKRQVQQQRGAGGAGGSYYNQQQYRQQYGQQYEQPQYQQEYQTPPPSPYGHSVYRGSSMSGYGARVDASTYMANGRATKVGGSGSVFTAGRAHVDREDSFGESSELEHEEDAEVEEAEEEEEEEEEDEGEALYAIKWYKDNEEFYRYVPKATPQKTSYRVDGVRVVEEHSDSSRVLLRGLTINSTGLYRCEISAEAPNFSSVQGEGRLDIVYLPRDGPHIRGQQFQYQIGELLNLNCTSGKSHPASQLQWFINEQLVPDGRYLMHYNDTVHKHGLITSTLGLQLTVDARHFHNGAMRVKCMASISPVLWKGDKESVLQRRSDVIDNREAMLLVRSLASRLQHSVNLLLLIAVGSSMLSIT